MTRITHKRRLKKSIREALMIALIGTIMTVFVVSIWIGSVIQTSERLSEMSMEVME